MGDDSMKLKRTTPSSKESTHERIVEAAARAILRSGYGGTSVADIMKDVGLTHGGFYAHFVSREAMLAEAADDVVRQAIAALKAGQPELLADQTTRDVRAGLVAEPPVYIGA